MSDIQLWSDEEGREGLVPAAVKAAVRGKSVEDLSLLLDYLRPYAMGMMGEPSPKLMELFIAATRQRALLVGAYSHPAPKEPVVEPEVVESTAVDGRELGERVLEQLAKLEEDMRKEEGLDGPAQA